VKMKKYEEALPQWEKAYSIAPAADGRRNYHFTDGIKIYNHLYSIEKDPAKKQAHLNKVFELYDALADCYGDVGYVSGRKAFDYYYKYPGTKTDMEIYQEFKKSIDTDGLKTNYFVLNPFTALMVNLYLEEKIPMTEAQTYTQKINDILINGLDNCKTAKACEPWKIIEEYAPARLAQLEGVRGFYDCEYYKNKYFPEYEGNKSDCDVVRSFRGKLNWANCVSTDPKLMEVSATYTANCKKPDPIDPVQRGPKCRDFLENGNYMEAINCYEGKAEATTDSDKKGRYYLVIAKIYYGELKKFSSARKYARKAASAKSAWGDPYMLIGKLYASSGPLCGPGRGWDSQIVTWPAIDMWNKAKSVDPSVASQANSLINKYRKFMPDKGDVFMRGLSEGASYKVPCRIQENTKVRIAK